MRRVESVGGAAVVSVSPTSAARNHRFAGDERRMVLWLNKQYGCSIVADDPATLVAAVADGVLLCKLARDLSGNSKLKFTANKPNMFKVNDNIAAFGTECKRMGLPDVCTLAASDVRDGRVANIMATLMRLYHMSRSGQLRGTCEGATLIVLHASDVSIEQRAEAILARISAKKKALAERARAEATVEATVSGGGTTAPPPTSIAGVVACIADGNTSFVDADWSLLETDALRGLMRDAAVECDRLQRQIASIDSDGQAGAAAAAAAGAAPSTGHFLGGGDVITVSRELLLLLVPQHITQCARLMLRLSRTEARVLLLQQQQQPLNEVEMAPMPGSDHKGAGEPAVVDGDDEFIPDTATSAEADVDPAVLEHVLSQLDVTITTEQAELDKASEECGRLVEAAVSNAERADGATNADSARELQLYHQQATRESYPAAHVLFAAVCSSVHCRWRCCFLALVVGCYNRQARPVMHRQWPFIYRYTQTPTSNATGCLSD
jgi:hypothetical protein